MGEFKVQLAEGDVEFEGYKVTVLILSDNDAVPPENILMRLIGHLSLNADGYEVEVEH